MLGVGGEVLWPINVTFQLMQNFLMIPSSEKIYILKKTFVSTRLSCRVPFKALKVEYIRLRFVTRPEVSDHVYCEILYRHQKMQYLFFNGFDKTAIAFSL